MDRFASKGTFAQRLAGLRGVGCESVLAVEYEDPPTDAIYAIGTSIAFTDGTKVDAQFWRLGKEGRPMVSTFDHRHQYGLPAPIDALEVLRGELIGKKVSEAAMDGATGDLRFDFEGGVLIEIFNFTAYEIWTVTFADGSGQLSNYALQEGEPGAVVVVRGE
jgi:hypothetical protein